MFACWNLELITWNTGRGERGGTGDPPLRRAKSACRRLDFGRSNACCPCLVSLPLLFLLQIVISAQGSAIGVYSYNFFAQGRSLWAKDNVTLKVEVGGYGHFGPLEAGASRFLEIKHVDCCCWLYLALRSAIKPHPST